MDHNDPSRLRYTDPAGTGQQQQQQQTGQLHHNPVTQGRVLQPAGYTPQQNITSAGPDNPQLYAFPQSMQYGGPSQHYGQDFVSHDQARQQQQQQQFSHYGPEIAYGMPQAHQSAQSSYGQMQQYRLRDGSTSETMSGPFPETNAAQYYAGAQPEPSTATQAGFGSSQMIQHYHPATYAPAGPSTAASTYTGTMIDPMHQPTYQAFGQQHTTLPAPQLQHQSHQAQIEQAVAQYQTNIRTVFTLVRDRSLREVAQPLIEASRFLHSNVEELGWVRDEEGQHDNRIMLWDEYNRAWLTTMQCQFDMTQDLLAERSLRGSQSTLDQDTIENLARELIRLCDGIEKHGLVDYQMGVAEDEIIEVILRCLSQLENANEDAAAEPEES